MLTTAMRHLRTAMRKAAVVSGLTVLAVAAMGAGCSDETAGDGTGGAAGDGGVATTSGGGGGAGGAGGIGGTGGVGGSSANTIDVLSGAAPAIDGQMASGEWDGAGTVEIEVDPQWTVTVHYMHGAADLYFAFANLVHGGQERYPEVLVDVAHDEGASWQSDDWWFHASYNDCEGQGQPNNYATCVPAAAGWEANNFPLAVGVVEIRISYAKLGLTPSPGKVVGIAFDVTDTTTEWRFWPQVADLDDPSTWGDATSSDDWIEP